MSSEPRRPMDAVDQLLYRQEGDPRRRTTVAVALVLDSEPEWNELVARVDRAIRASPQLRQRVVSPLPGTGAPEWAPDPDFDLTRHLRRAVLEAPGGRPELLRWAESVAVVPLDPLRPLWEATLLVGETGAPATLLIRLSHALIDGLAGVELLASLVDTEPIVGVELDDLPPPQIGELTSLGLTRDRLLALPVQAQKRALRNTLGLLRVTAGAINHPRDNADQAVRYARSLGRVLSSGGASASPALRGRSTARRYLTLEVSARTLRRAARVAGGTMNDGYLAAVLGGMRRYHEALGLDVAEMPFAIPVSTRPRRAAARESAGNRFAPVRFAAPVGLVDPVQRIQALSEIVRTARAEPALDAMTTFAPALAQLPSPVLALAARAQDRLDVQASYVPGPPVPVYLAGRAVTGIFALGPLPGPAVMTVLLTYGENACVGFTVDAAAVADLDLFERCALEGFDEVISLAGG